MNKRKQSVTDLRKKSEAPKQAKDLEERVVQIKRVSKVIKGGRKMSFNALVVVGDKQGRKPPRCKGPVDQG